MSLPKSWTTVTPLSKTIAIILFAFLPLIAFFAGVRYQQKLDEPLVNKPANVSVIQKEVIVTPTPTISPTCIPRPSCLDATPRCMIAESSSMCPAQKTK